MFIPLWTDDYKAVARVQNIEDTRETLIIGRNETKMSKRKFEGPGRFYGCSSSQAFKKIFKYVSKINFDNEWNKTYKSIYFEIF